MIHSKWQMFSYSSVKLSKFYFPRFLNIKMHDRIIFQKCIFTISFILQEHFIDNAKLSEKYFIVNCEQLLVCLSKVALSLNHENFISMLYCSSLVISFIKCPYIIWLFTDFPSNCFVGVVCTCWHQKVAAVIDGFPLELRDKYLFCIRYILIFSENNIFRMQYPCLKVGCLYFISLNLLSYFLTDTHDFQSCWHGWWDFISRPDTGNY